MAHTGFLDAVGLLDWIGIESKSSGRTREKIPILKQELRFLSTFLKYTANRCTENEFLRDLLARIGDVGKDINKLNTLASSRPRRSAVDGTVRDILDKINLLKPGIQIVQKEVLTSSGSDICMIDGTGRGLVEYALDLVNVKPDQLGEIQMQVSSSLTNDELVEFIDSLLENLERLLGREVNLLDLSLKELLRALKEQLEFLKGVYSLTASRCNEHDDDLNRLSAYVQPVADMALYLTNYCFNNGSDENTTYRLAIALSELVQNIDPSYKPEAREIYVGVLIASLASGSRSMSNIHATRKTLVVFVGGSLLKMTRKLLDRDTMSVKDQMEMLHVELRSLEYFLEDTREFPILKGSDYVFTSIEDIVIKAGYLSCKLFEGEVNQQEVDEMRLSLSTLLDMFKIGKKLVRDLYSNLKKAQMPNFPRTDERGALDRLLQNLEELLNDGLPSIELLKDHIQIVQRDLQVVQSFLPAISMLRSFLSTIRERHHERKKVEDLWWRFVHVVYELQYVIDLFMVKDGPVLRHMLWLSDLIDDIKIIKTEINEIQKSDENQDKLQSNISKPKTPQTNAPGIDEEMVGFEEEVKSIEQELLYGPKLQIISIVGMPGLGKTFLTRKVYNDPKIINHFLVRAWCNITQIYERKELLITLLSQIVKSSEEMTWKTDEELAADLYRHLLGQRYLIVLDDIWDITWWVMLKRSFPDDRNGSRIVLTSRLSSLASQIGVNSKPHELQPLSLSDSWKLLEKKIFRKRSCPLELHEIGNQIANSCHGLPLAIVVVAGVLASTEIVQERWRDFANGLNSYLRTETEAWWMNIMDLSYKNLPGYLKSCFLYCGAFLPAKEISVMKLIWLWIAEGFIQENDPNLKNIAEGSVPKNHPNKEIIVEGAVEGKIPDLEKIVERLVQGNNPNVEIVAKWVVEGNNPNLKIVAQGVAQENNPRLENMAEDYLMDLIDRNLIIASKGRSSGSFKACLVHDLIRNFCIAKAKEENFLQLIEAHLLSSSHPRSYEQHRLSVHYRRPGSFWSESSGPYVRSALLFAPGRLDLGQAEVSSIILGFKLLKVLDLMCVDLGATFPEGIASLGLLRYLAVAGSFSSVSPSITNLRELKSFLVKTADLVSLSYDILKNLIKLRHLQIKDRMRLVQSSYDGRFRMGNLQYLTRLYLHGRGDMQIIERFPNLKKLSCTLEEPLDSSGLLVLQILLKLEALKISYHGTMKYPYEFSLPENIKKLTLSGFRLPWEKISVIWRLPNLEVLKLLSDAFEGEEWNMEEEEAFPKLKFLKLESLDISTWTAFDHGDDHFQYLEVLILEDCVQLEEILFLEDIYSLRMIQVEDCSHSLEESMKQLKKDQEELGNEDLQLIIKPRETQATEPSSDPIQASGE